MVLRLKQPLAVGVGGCPACCWRQPSAACTKDTLQISLLLSGVPRACPFIHGSVTFNGGSEVDGGGCCFTDTYVTTSSSGGYLNFFVSVWDALEDGAWTSSTTIEVRSGTGLTIDFGPTSDTAADCWQYGFVPAAFVLGCAGALGATITIMDDGTMSIA